MLERIAPGLDLWQAVGASRGTDGRDALWADPHTLPSAADLDDPAAFVDRDREFSELLAGLGDLDVDLQALTAEAAEQTDPTEATDPGPTDEAAEATELEDAGDGKPDDPPANPDRPV